MIESVIVQEILPDNIIPNESEVKETDESPKVVEVDLSGENPSPNNSPGQGMARDDQEDDTEDPLVIPSEPEINDLEQIGVGQDPNDISGSPVPGHPDDYDEGDPVGIDELSRDKGPEEDFPASPK